MNGEGTQELDKLLSMCEESARNLKYYSTPQQSSEWLQSLGYSKPIPIEKEPPTVTGGHVFQESQRIVSEVFKDSDLAGYATRVFDLQDIHAFAAGLWLLLARHSVQESSISEVAEFLFDKVIRIICSLWWQVTDKARRSNQVRHLCDSFCHHMLFGFFSEISGNLANDAFATIVSNVITNRETSGVVLQILSYQILTTFASIEDHSNLPQTAWNFPEQDVIDIIERNKSNASLSWPTEKQAQADLRNATENSFATLFQGWLVLTSPNFSVTSLEQEIMEDCSCEEFNADYCTDVSEEWRQRIRQLLEAIREDDHFGCVFANCSWNIDTVETTIIGYIVDCAGKSGDLGPFVAVGAVVYMFSKVFCEQLGWSDQYCIACMRQILSYFVRIVKVVKPVMDIDASMDDRSRSIRKFRNEKEFSWNDISSDWVRVLFCDLHRMDDLAVLWSLMIWSCRDIPEETRAEPKKKESRLKVRKNSKVSVTPETPNQCSIFASNMCMAHALDFQPESFHADTGLPQEMFRKYKRWDIGNIARIYKGLLGVTQGGHGQGFDAREEEWEFNFEKDETIVKQVTSWLSFAGVTLTSEGLQKVFQEYTTITKKPIQQMPGWFADIRVHAEQVVKLMAGQTQWELKFADTFHGMIVRIFTLFWGDCDQIVRSFFRQMDRKEKDRTAEFLPCIVVAFLSIRQMVDEIAMESHSKRFRDALSEALAYKVVSSLAIRLAQGFTTNTVDTVFHDFCAPQNVRIPMVGLLDEVYWSFFTVNHALTSIQEIWTILLSDKANFFDSVLSMCLSHIALIVEQFRDEQDGISIESYIRNNSEFVFTLQRVLELFQTYQSMNCPKNKNEADVFLSQVLEMKRYSYRVVAWFLHFGILESFDWSRRRRIFMQIQQNYLDLISDLEQNPETATILEKAWIGKPIDGPRHDSQQIEKDVHRMTGYYHETCLKMEILEDKDIFAMMYKVPSPEMQQQKSAWSQAMSTHWHHDQTRISRILHMCCIIDSDSYGYYQGMSRPATICFALGKRASVMFGLDDVCAEAIAFYLLRSFLRLMKDIIQQISSKEPPFITTTLELLEVNKKGVREILYGQIHRLVESMFLDPFRLNIPAAFSIWDKMIVTDDLAAFTRSFCAVLISQVIELDKVMAMSEADFTDLGCVICDMIKQADTKS